MLSSSSIEIQVIAKAGNKIDAAIFFYDRICCVGEVIRNICVNFGFDPDTEDGFTKNVQVFLLKEGDDRCLWNYDPEASLESYTKSSKLSIEMKRLY